MFVNGLRSWLLIELMDVFKRKKTIAKFGGSTITCAKDIIYCAQIIEQNPYIRLVVISAFSKTTKSLKQIFSLCERRLRKKAQIKLKKIIDNYIDIFNQLDFGPHDKKEFTNIIERIKTNFHLISSSHFKEQKIGEWISQGEFLSSFLFKIALKNTLKNKKSIHLFDIRSCFRTEGSFTNSNLLFKETKKLIRKNLEPLINRKSITVTQGFLASDIEGNTTILGANTSDYTACYLASVIKAEHVIIYSDVNGIYNIDPKIQAKNKKFEDLSYTQAYILSSLGMRMVHPNSFEHIKNSNITLDIRNPKSKIEGTIIRGPEVKKDFIQDFKAIVINDSGSVFLIAPKKQDIKNQAEKMALLVGAKEVYSKMLGNYHYFQADTKKQISRKLGQQWYHLINS